MKVMLAGPIKAWWDEWESPQHKHYVAWRDALSQALVDAGHLVYRPHEAFKGQWHESAQAVNDVALRTSDVIANLTPEGVPSLGTDDEIDYARRYNRRVVATPPPSTQVDAYYARRAVRKLERAFAGEDEQLDMARVARSLLWVLDSNTSLDSIVAKDIVREARDALGVNTV